MEGSAYTAYSYSSLLRARKPLCSSMKSETIIPDPFPFGFIILLPFSPHCKFWSSLRLKCPLIMEVFLIACQEQVIREDLLCSFCWCICRMQEIYFYHLAGKLNMGCYNFWSFMAINKDPSEYVKAHFMQPVLCSFNRDWNPHSRVELGSNVLCNGQLSLTS